MFNEKDLLNRRGLGKRTLREIKNKLQQQGLKLKRGVKPIKPDLVRCQSTSWLIISNPGLRPYPEARSGTQSKA